MSEMDKDMLKPKEKSKKTSKNKSKKTVKKEIKKEDKRTEQSKITEKTTENSKPNKKRKRKRKSSKIEKTKKSKKNLTMLIMFIISLFMVLLVLILCYKINYDKQIIKHQKDIDNHYNNYVITIKDTNLYKLKNNKYIKSGSISSNQELSLEPDDKSDEYFKITTFKDEYYIYYKDIKNILSLTKILLLKIL